MPAGALEQQGHLAAADDPDRATDLHHEALAVRLEHGLRIGYVDSLDALAGLAASADHAREMMGCPRRPVDAPAHNATVGAVKAALGADGFTDAWAEGASLAPTELDVVRLVAEGLNNPEIGARLFMSRGTVKTHLSMCAPSSASQTEPSWPPSPPPVSQRADPMERPTMSYPEPRYLGDTGEARAVYRPSNQKPELTYESGPAVDYLATGASTDGDFGLYRWTFGPNETGPGPHFHKTISESFFILSGTVRLYNGERWVEATTGDFLYVPPGGIHGFKNDNREPASMLLLFTPGAPREDYFETLAAVAEGKEMSQEETAAFFLRHDNYWV